jgi:hypothetical protein
MANVSMDAVRLMLGPGAEQGKDSPAPFVGICRGRSYKKSHLQKKEGSRRKAVKFKKSRASRERKKEVVKSSREGRATQTKGLAYMQGEGDLGFERRRHPCSNSRSAK